MFKIKQKLEDFYVEEINELNFGDGDYIYFSLEKRGWNTRDVIRLIAIKLRVKESFFNVAGMKDKNAVTKQYISVFNVDEKRLENIKIKNVEIKVLGRGKERLRLGQLKYNKFRIVVRNLDREYNGIDFIENYFDDQRFSGRNHLIGKALVKKEFSKICSMLRLNVNNNDYVNPVRKIGFHKLRFYINAYQSYLFNEYLKEYFIKNYKDYYKVDYFCGEFVFGDGGIKNKKVPIIGFLSEGNEYDRLLKKEGVTKDDFLIRQIPEVSSEGNERDLIVKVDKLKVKYSDDEMNKGNLKAILEFNLSKGSYGTIVVKKMFSQPL